MYPSAPRQLVPYPPSHYNLTPPINDYFVGHAVLSTPQLPSYTCLGSPVGRRGEGKDTSSTVPNNNNNYNDSTSNNNNNNEEEEEGEEDEEGS